MYKKNYTEREVYQLIKEHIPTPKHFFIPLNKKNLEISKWTIPPDFLRASAVVKISSPSILHKSDSGGIAFIETLNKESLDSAIKKLRENLGPQWSEIDGILVSEKIIFPQQLGQQLYFGVKYSREFGYLFSIGIGGLSIEELNARFKEGQASILFHPLFTPKETLVSKLQKTLFFRAITGQIRGYPKLIEPKELLTQIDKIAAGISAVIKKLHAKKLRVIELEFNPLVINNRKLTPLDGVLRVEGFNTEKRTKISPSYLSSLLYPKSIAIAGISLKNSKSVGRIILQNLLDTGFSKKNIYIIRPKIEEFQGIQCYSSIAKLPTSVDLAILAVSADAVPQILQELFTHKKARTVLLIPGGMGETPRGKSLEEEIKKLLEAYREDPKRPILLGNNSLGMASHGAFDSLFIPPEKFPRRPKAPSLPMAFLSQSGAFIITRTERLLHGVPQFQISLGNQLDAGLCDFIEFLLDKDSVRIFAIYSEGLRDGEGERLAELIREGNAKGREFIIYKAGRNPKAKEAIAGHTASIVGDYRAFKEILTDAGALIADSFEEFTDLIMLASTLNDKEFHGNRAFFMSNAGYESVGMIDNISGENILFKVARLSQKTIEKIEFILEKKRLLSLVNIQNPLDITPMADDETHIEIIEAVLNDHGVDIGIFGNVPYTVMVNTLPAGIVKGEDMAAGSSYPNRIVEKFKSSKKPFVIIIDGGATYEPLASFMKSRGVPIFKSADRAVKTLAKYSNYRKKFRSTK